MMMARSVRIASMVMAGVVSLVTGLMLAERIIRPGIIDDFGTAALLGLVMLLVLPALTLIALRHDRDEAVRLAGHRAGAEHADPANDPTLVEGELALPPIGRRMVRHHAHPRTPIAGRSAEGPAGGEHADRFAELKRVG
jgi:hypothetical protein